MPFRAGLLTTSLELSLSIEPWHVKLITLGIGALNRRMTLFAAPCTVHHATVNSFSTYTPRTRRPRME